MAAGTIPISMTQQFDVLGQPLGGGQLYIIQAGTVSTPQDAFADVALTIKQPYPMTLDAAGRVPQFFLDNSVNAGVKIRLQDKSGVVQLASDFVLIIGPAGGTGGGGTTVDLSTICQTGDMKARYGVGVMPGAIPNWVRCNGLSIGPVGSGASEHFGVECQPLFLYLWNTDPNLSVGNPPNNTVPGSGRGSSAPADWTNGKQISLPDFRGYAPTGLDAMGNVDANRLTAAFFGGTPDQLGAVGGAESLALAIGQLPAITSVNTVQPITVGPSAGAGARSYIPGTNGTIAYEPAPSSGGNNVPTSSIADWAYLSSTFSGNNSISVASQNTNGAAHRTLGPRKLVTFYLKLALPIISVLPLIGTLCEKLGT